MPCQVLGLVGGGASGGSGALAGGWTVGLLPIYGWVMFSVLDAALGLNRENADPATPDAELLWYRLITLIWFPVQAGLLLWLIWYVPQAAHLDRAERLVLFFGMGWSLAPSASITHMS